MEPPNHLIIVCGHAIWAGGPTNGLEESEWIMESWKKGETPTYTEHIKAGLRALREDDRAVLMFSGGPTSTQTQLSEARSYFNLAAANNHWAIVTASQISRIHVEDRALDSHQNILLSILHFWRVQSRWPTHLTIVSHAFKRRRLVQAHCSALSLPLDRVQYVGINPPGIPEVVENEERAVEEWLSDPQGTSEGLRRKRKGRNPWGVEQRLFLDDAERMRSGLTTSIVQDEEILIENSAKPWVEE